MHQAIYERLRQIAKAQNTTTYSEVAPLAGLDMANPADRNEIARILGEISSFEHGQGRPMLSAVVMLQGDNMPGQGFFTLARELGLYTGGDDLTFFARELARVHASWR
jgi:hypothetical protein